MSIDFTVVATTRADQGKGASRRLRRSGMVPGVVYGGGKAPQSLSILHSQVLNHLRNEAFYSHILKLEVDGKKENVILRDMQRHAYKPLIQHMDFLRVKADSELKMNVPLHFMNEEESVGVKGGGIASHLMIDVEIACLPKDLPEYIEVDMAALDIGDSIHLSELKLPEGVTLTAFSHGEDDEHDYDVPVASIHPRKLVEEEEDEGEAEAGDEDQGAAEEDKGESED